MPSLSFKNFTDAYDLSSLHPKLKKILNFVIHETGKKGWELEITSVFRDDGGVHEYYRGVDVVPVDRDESKMEWIRVKVNSTFDYCKGEIEVCPDIHHGTAPHCHLQSWDKTTKISRSFIASFAEVINFKCFFCI